MNTKGFASVLIGALSEYSWAHEFKHASNTHDWLLTATCVIASFFIFMLALKYVGAALAYVLYTGLGALFIVLLETIVALKEDSEINLLRIFFIFTLNLCTGIGTIGAVMLGIFVHREKIFACKAPLLFLIISSAVMFKLI